VPYHTSPRGPNAKALTKSKEMECAAVSLLVAMWVQVAPWDGSTKIPSP
jgi:hypothetical protein